jgi:hypothetical protein
MLIRYRNGLVVEAVILSLTGSKMRVAPKNGEDVVEYRLVKDIWISEDGEPVAFDFTMSILAAVGIEPPADLVSQHHDPVVSHHSLFNFPYSSDRAN